MKTGVASPPPNFPKPTWNVPPWIFEQQLQGLISRGWKAWPLSQVIECLERDLPIPRLVSDIADLVRKYPVQSVLIGLGVGIWLARGSKR